MTDKQKEKHTAKGLQSLATLGKGVLPPRPCDIGKVLGTNKRPISFHGLSPVFWFPPSIRPFPIFPLGGETPVEVTDVGSCGIVDARKNRMVVFRTLPVGGVCDMSSVPDIAARLTGISKSDMMPQGVFHDTGYRHGLRNYAFELPFSAVAGNDDYEGRNVIAKSANLLRYIGGQGDFADMNDLGDGKSWTSFLPDQEWCDDLFRVLLLNFNSGVLPSHRRLLAWLAVRVEGDGSFRNKKMAFLCDATAQRIDHYCSEYRVD